MFRWRQDSKSYFSNITSSGGYAGGGSDNKEKFIMFDPYYYCALIGLASVSIDEDENNETNNVDLVQDYPEAYKSVAPTIAGLLIATEVKRRGVNIGAAALEDIMVKYISHDSTMLSDFGVKRLNSYSRQGAKIYQEAFPDKPSTKEEFIEGFYSIIQTIISNS